MSRLNAACDHPEFLVNDAALVTAGEIVPVLDPEPLRALQVAELDDLRTARLRDRHCEAKLDPIEVLVEIAREWRSESFHARRIAEFERKEYDKATDRAKRFVRQHVVCHGCGLETRLTLGALTGEDWAAWDRHWGTEPEHPAPWDSATTMPEREHRRRTEADIEAHRRLIEPVPMTGVSIYVDRAPRPEHNTPRAATHPSKEETVVEP